MTDTARAEISKISDKSLRKVIASCYHICMARKKVSTTVYLTEEQVVALKELHERTRVPIAEYIRMGIDLILDKHSEKLPGQVSLFDGGEELGRRRRAGRPVDEEKTATAD